MWSCGIPTGPLNRETFIRTIHAIRDFGSLQVLQVDVMKIDKNPPLLFSPVFTTPSKTVLENHYVIFGL